MRKKLQTLYIEEPVFKTSTLIIWNCDYLELAKFLDKKHNVELTDLDHLKGADGTVINLDGAPYRVVWFEKFKLTPYWLGVATHELTHHVVRILNHKGIPFDGYQNNDEPFAYLMDFYMSSLVEKYKKKCYN